MFFTKKSGQHHLLAERLDQRQLAFMLLFFPVKFSVTSALLGPGPLGVWGKPLLAYWPIYSLCLLLPFSPFDARAHSGPLRGA